VSKYLDNSAFIVVEEEETGFAVAAAVNKLNLDLVCFTGSTYVGKIVAEAAAKHMTPCILELGGKCPAVVDRGCDLAATVNKICSTKFSNSG
jgi:aldehyde dehydrogenase (NAD+)